MNSETLEKQESGVTTVKASGSVVDLANAHLKALDRAAKVTGVERFNIGTGVGYSVVIKICMEAESRGSLKGLAEISLTVSDYICCGVKGYLTCIISVNII